MTERPIKQQEREDKGASGPKVQDISKLVEKSTITIQDLDQRMQQMRASLAQLIAQANYMQGGASAPQWGEGPQGVGWPAQVGPLWNLPTPLTSSGDPFEPYQSRSVGQAAFGAGLLGGTGATSITPIPISSIGAFGGTRTTRDLKDLPPQTRQPPSDVVDDGNNFQIRLEMPGVKKEDMDIMVTDRAVLVTALARLDLEDGMVVQQERGPVVYRRTIQLPGEIKTSECQAKLKDGVLKLSVPKKNPTDSPRHLEIAYG